MEENSRLKKIIDLYVDKGQKNEYLHDEMIKAFNNASPEEKKEGYEYLNLRLKDAKENTKVGESKYSEKAGIFIFLILIAIIVCIVIVTNNTKDKSSNYISSNSYSNTSYSKKSESNYSSSYVTDDEKGDAVAIAQDEVKSRLKSPSSAKFPWSFDEYTITKSGDIFTVNSYVEAKNSYGTLLKIKYIVQFTVTGKDKYIVNNVIIDE